MMNCNNKIFQVVFTYNYTSCYTWTFRVVCVLGVLSSFQLQLKKINAFSFHSHRSEKRFPLSLFRSGSLFGYIVLVLNRLLERTQGVVAEALYKAGARCLLSIKKGIKRLAHCYLNLSLIQFISSC